MHTPRDILYNKSINTFFENVNIETNIIENRPIISIYIKKNYSN